MHFVIVEDDFHSAEAMRLLLERQGHRVDLCLDASDAVDFIRVKRPDVALLDIMMPGIDGIEIGRRIHSVPGLEDLKSVVITGKPYDVDRQRAFAAGSCGFILKPFDPRYFVEDVVACATTGALPEAV